MPAPRLAPEARDTLLGETHVAKIATHDEDGSIRITPLWFNRRDDGTIEFSTWMWTRTAQNIARSPQVTVMIDTVEHPYRGIHMKGTAQLGPESADPTVFGRWFGRYTGSEESGVGYAQQLIDQGGPRVPIVFTPERTYTWDFSEG